MRARGNLSVGYNYRYFQGLSISIYDVIIQHFSAMFTYTFLQRLLMVLVSMLGLPTSHRYHISYRAVKKLSSGEILVSAFNSHMNGHLSSIETEPIFLVSIVFKEIPVSTISSIWYRYRPTLDLYQDRDDLRL